MHSEEHNIAPNYTCVVALYKWQFVYHEMKQAKISNKPTREKTQKKLKNYHTFANNQEIIMKVQVF